MPQKEVTLVRLPTKLGFTFAEIPNVKTNYSPGFGVIYTFLDNKDLGGAFVIAYQRPNLSANNALQLCIAIGGKVDLGTAIVGMANKNILSKTNVDALYIKEAALKDVQATVYNEQGNGWNMSYVYTHYHLNQRLSELRGLVENINQRIDQKKQINSDHSLSKFGIYRLAAILILMLSFSRMRESI